MFTYILFVSCRSGEHAGQIRSIHQCFLIVNNHSPGAKLNNKSTCVTLCSTSAGRVGTDDGSGEMLDNGRRKTDRSSPLVGISSITLSFPNVKQIATSVTGRIRTDRSRRLPGGVRTGRRYPADDGPNHAIAASISLTVLSTMPGTSSSSRLLESLLDVPAT